MANVTRTYTMDFGPAYTGLATVGYTLTGGTRSTSGVSESAAGTGIYEVAVTHDADFSGRILWDTGGGSPVYEAEAINPTVLGSAGLDSIPTTAPTAPATTFRGMLVQLWHERFGLSKFVRTNSRAGTFKTLSDDGNTAYTTQAVTDDGVTQTVGKAT